MAQEFGAKLTLKDNFSDVIQKAVTATETLRKKLQETEKNLSKIGDKKVKIGAQLDSSVNSSLNKLHDKIPKDKVIRIKAKDEVTRSITNMQRDIYKMGRDLSLGMKDPFNGLRRSSQSAIISANNLRNALKGIAAGKALAAASAAQSLSHGLAAPMVAAAAAGRASAAARAAKATTISPFLVGRRYSTKEYPAGSKKRGYTGDPDYHDAKAKYHSLGHGDEPPYFDRQSRSMRYFDGNYANMIARQQAAMKKMYGKKYMSAYSVKDEHIGGGDYLRVLDRKLGRAGYAYQRTKEWAGEKAGAIKAKLELDTGKAMDKFREFKKKIGSSKMGEISMRMKFAGERGAYGFKNTMLDLKARLTDNGVSRKISSILSSANKLNGRTFSFNVKANVANAKAALEKLNDKISTVGLVSGAVIAGGAMKAIKGAADLESNMMSIEHFVKYANTKNVSEGKESQKSDDQIKSESADYIGKLRKYAVDTPFGDTEVISAGRRAVNVMGGNLGDAEELVKIAGDMAALNPGKTIMDAMEALADMKTGEMERMKEFGLKISAEQFKGLVGKGKNDDLSEEEQLKAYKILMEHKMKTMFGGGAQKLSTTASGKFSTVTGTLESGLADIGTKFLPGIKTGLDKIIGALETSGPKIIAAFQPLADAFNAFMDSPLFTGENALMVGGFVAAAAALSALCTVVIMIVMPIITVVGWIAKLGALAGPLAKGIGLIRTAMMGLNLAFLANPVTWVILGIVALIAAGVALYVYWDEVKQFFMDMWVGPSQVIDQFIAFLQEAFDIGFNFLLNNAKIIMQFFSDLWYNPETAFDNYLNNVKSNFGEVADWLIQKWQAVCDFFSSNTPSANADVSWSAGAGLDTSGGDGGSERAVGMEYVPYNGFQVSAHRGEAILTRTEADQWREGRGGAGGSVIININDPVVREESDLDRLGTLLASKICEVRSNMGAVPA